MKTITIAGIEKCDFCYYVARTLATRSNLVLVVDNSINKELFRCMEQGMAKDEDDNYVAKKGEILYLKDIAFSQDFFAAFEYVLIYQGMNFDKEIMEKTDLIFILPDFKPETLGKSSDMPEKAEYLLRDRAGKMTEKAAATIIGISANRIIGSVDADADDYGCYLALLCNGRQRPGSVTNGYKEMIAYTAARIMDIPVKEAMKSVKKARG